MHIKKIFILGCSGMLGNYVYSYFIKKADFNVINIEFRITIDNINKIEEVLIANNIDNETCVINCIGAIPQRTNDINKYYVINSLFPHVLSKICQKYNSRMIHPCTDCVFSGNNGNYKETDKHDEINDYGYSKSIGEPLNCTLIRTSIIGLELKNKKSFMEWVLSSVQNKKFIDCWDNHIWNGITCLEYCELLYEIIKNNCFWKGVKHFYSPNVISKYDLAKLIVEIFLGNEYLMYVKKNSTNKFIDKSLSSNYNLIYKIKTIKEQITKLKNFELKIHYV